MSRLPTFLSLLIVAGIARAAAIQQFSPQGRIDQQTRATALFNADMAKLGDAAAPSPFEVDCGEVKGEGRWIDARSWAWQLERPLQAGERCQFTAKPGLTALNGEAVTGRVRFEFFAAGPWPRSILPRPGAAIDEDQVFVINAGGPMKPESVEKSLWCEADGVGQRIPVHLVPEPQRTEVIKHSYGGFGPTATVVACAERLPHGAKMKLTWGKGVEAMNGTKSEKEESFVYPVREPFRASLSCEREKANAPCSPLSNVTVDFNAEVPAQWAGQVRLVVAGAVKQGAATVKADGKVWLQPAEGDGERTSSTRQVVFRGPWPENAELRLELPKEMKDEAGRALDNAAKFPLSFRTAALPPLAKFPGDFGIVELKEGGVLPVTLRRVE
ncbi:MAG TPA: hypothetical protein VMB75_09075, partial [Rhodocyclaceae bacterium]|nr:hypothetical protein [Rhodocyclaceae bacterium]